MGYTLGTSKDNLCTAVACSFTYTSINRGNCHTYLVRGYTLIGTSTPPPPGKIFQPMSSGGKICKGGKEKREIRKKNEERRKIQEWQK